MQRSCTRPGSSWWISGACTGRAASHFFAIAGAGHAPAPRGPRPRAPRGRQARCAAARVPLARRFDVGAGSPATSTCSPSTSPLDRLAVARCHGRAGLVELRFFARPHRGGSGGGARRRADYRQARLGAGADLAVSRAARRARVSEPGRLGAGHARSFTKRSSAPPDERVAYIARARERPATESAPSKSRRCCAAHVTPRGSSSDAGGHHTTCPARGRVARFAAGSRLVPSRSSVSSAPAGWAKSTGRGPEARSHGGDEGPRPDRAAQPRNRERLPARGLAVSRLTHPHVCTQHDVGVQQAGAATRKFLVMELLDGETLAARLAPRGPPIARRCRSASSSSRRWPRRTRWGSSTAISSRATDADEVGREAARLRPGPVPAGHGSERIIERDAPMIRSRPRERSSGPCWTWRRSNCAARPLTPAATSLAFGAVLYEAITGVRAFVGNSQAELAAAILEHEPAANQTTRQPLAPTQLDQLVTRCLAEAPADRWPHARDVVVELRGIEARGVSRPSRRLLARGTHALRPRTRVHWFRRRSSSRCLMS